MLENKYWNTEHFVEEDNPGCEESCSINEGKCPNGMDCDLPSRQEDEDEPDDE